jgi:putative intracellular protease/amidase
MRKSLIILACLGLFTAASVWATSVPPSPLAEDTGPVPTNSEKIAAYQPRFGRDRPLVAIVGENSATELTDFVIPYGILAEAGIADLVTVATSPGPLTMRPALRLRPDTTIGGFDGRFPQGADYVIVPAVVKQEDPALLAWIRDQAATGSTIVSICDGAFVVANTGLMNGHRATAHWATLGHRRDHYPDVTWVENRRYVADGKIVSSAGISAAIPTSLALVEAIAGRAKATAVAAELGAPDWSTRHNSQVFAPRFGHNLTALATTMFINPKARRQESIGVPIAGGADEIALALTADAYSRTGLSKAYSVASSTDPVRTRHGLTILPDLTGGQVQSAARLVPLPNVPAGAQLDAALAGIGRDYGRLAAFAVALDFEYPGFK